MSFKVQPTPHFAKGLKALAKRHKSLKSDFSDLVEELKNNASLGTELSPGIRKIRLAITSKGRGNSGGARVITYTVATTEIDGTVYLIEIYDKVDTSTVKVELLKKMILEIGL